MPRDDAHPTERRSAPRAHYLQHVPFEGLGSIGPWLDAQGFTVTATRFFDDARLPAAGDVDFVVVMGGPMSVNDEAAYPWLAAEREFLRSVVDAGKPVLGVCLGAQLLASAMGARVVPNRVKEIGWYPVQAVPTADQSVFRFPAELEVFHWHGETFDLPTGSIRLARSEACENQAFQLGPAAIGLQFHLETTPESALEIVAACRDELQPSRFVQSDAEILAASEQRYRAIHGVMSEILSYLHRAGGLRP